MPNLLLQLYARLPVLLAAVNDGSKDLFNADWTEGNLYRITGLTDNLGTFACWVISAVGFMIVIFAILKNALSGLYVVNPQLWDRVAEIKDVLAQQAVSSVQQMGQMTNSQAGNVVFNKLGGLMSFVLTYLPNVKDLTDFDEVPVDKKQYFMHAIPVLVAQIFIGMMIFFGYPAKIANWVGSAGTEVIDMVLNNVDPVGTVSNIAGKYQNVDFNTSHSTVPYQKKVYEASASAWRSIVTQLSDMEKGPKQQLAYEIESSVQAAFAPAAEVIGAENGYVVTANGYYSGSQPAARNEVGMVQIKDSGIYQSTANNGTITYVADFSLEGFTLGNSQKITGTDCFTVEFVCTPVAVASNRTYQGTVYFNAGTPVTVNTSNTKITLGSIKFSKGSTPQSQAIYGVPGTSCSYSLKLEDGTPDGGQGQILLEGTDLILYISKTLKSTSPVSILTITPQNKSNFKWQATDNQKSSYNIPIIEFVHDSGKAGKISLVGTGSGYSIESESATCANDIKAGNIEK